MISCAVLGLDQFGRNLPPSHCQRAEGICAVARPVVARLVLPAAVVLVPFLAVGFQRLEPLAGFRLVKVAKRDGRADGVA
jgi:hypothetical protein